MLSDPDIKLPALIEDQIAHLRNTAYADGKNGEPSGSLDRVHERLGVLILLEMKRARKEDADLIRQMLEALQRCTKYDDRDYEAVIAARTRLLDSDLSHLTERGKEAWKGVDPQKLREGGAL